MTKFTSIIPVQELIDAARALRTAQKDYLADRGNEDKGRAVGAAAKVLDEKLAEIDKRTAEYPKYEGHIKAARDNYADDDCEIDDQPMLAPTGSGVWVNAWVWVANGDNP